MAVRHDGCRPSSADPRRTESAIAAAGLHVDKRLELGTEWGEFAEERSGKGGRNCSMARGCFAIRTATSRSSAGARTTSCWETVCGTSTA